MIRVVPLQMCPAILERQSFESHLPAPSMDIQGRSQSLQNDGRFGGPSGTYYLLGCIAIMGIVVVTHPTGPGIGGGHI